MLQTVAETTEFRRQACRLMGEVGRQSLIAFLAARPRAGDLMPGTGGIRKLRWQRPGMGKRGGVRVIYYFHSEVMPLYLLTVFGKGERSDLSMAERNELRLIVDLLVEAALGG